MSYNEKKIVNSRNEDIIYVLNDLIEAGYSRQTILAVLESIRSALMLIRIDDDEIGSILPKHNLSNDFAFDDESGDLLITFREEKEIPDVSYILSLWRD